MNATVRSARIDFACVLGIVAAVVAGWDVGFALHLALTAVAGVAVGFVIISVLLPPRRIADE